MGYIVPCHTRFQVHHTIFTALIHNFVDFDSSFHFHFLCTNGVCMCAIHIAFVTIYLCSKSNFSFRYLFGLFFFFLYLSCLNIKYIRSTNALSLWFLCPNDKLLVSFSYFYKENDEEEETTQKKKKKEKNNK